MGLAHAQAYPADADGALFESEHDLFERAKTDSDAFGGLYQRHYRMLSNYVFRRTGDVNATEDLVADAFMIVMRTLPRYRSRGVPLRFWLLRITTNVVNRWARRQRRRMALPLEADHLAGKTVSTTTGKEESEGVQRALLSLPPRYQAVLSLYHVEGLSVRETATILGCREGTVRSRLVRARDALRRQLSQGR